MSRARSRTGLRRQLSVVLLGLVPLLPTGCGSRYSTADFARAAGDTGSDEAARPSAGDTVPGPQTTAGGGADGTAAETPSPAATATASGGRPSGSGSTSAASGGTGGGSGAGTAAGSGTSTGPAATPAGKPPTGGASTVSPTAGPSGPKAEIVLGTFGTESGPVGANVVTAPVGIRAWLASINARGGLNGHPVRIIFGGDDGGDPARALAITRRLVEDDKVIGLLTPVSPRGGRPTRRNRVHGRSASPSPGGTGSSR
jgi:branched-chain amino acid transport system substrate-binding protein